MKYLLDVNSLLALGVLHHEFHPRVAAWLERLASNGVPELATCSITELGFVRVLGQAQQYGSSVTQARELLLELLLKVTEIKTVPFVPLSHPFVERLIGTLRRECPD